MISAIQHFINAHEHCLTLEEVLEHVTTGSQRDALKCELLAAYDDLERKTQALVRARFAQDTEKELN